ncbi:MAG: GtrA family protein [Oscillospiraceae bacterium]|jgi:putative flippase GtrA|nr:GtrA family protein [Oscillospiraceae bacterium]
MKIFKKHRELALYIFFGGLTTLVSIAVQFGADYLGANIAAATTLAWICAVTFAFIVNKTFVFKSKSHWLRQAATFCGARLSTYFLELGFMLVTVENLLFNMHVMKIIAQVFVLMGNYLFSKFFIFRKKEQKNEIKSNKPGY